MMENTSRYTGTKIRAVLEAQGRRQDWLAEQAGISRAHLNLTINGKRTISEDVARRIASALGVPFFVIFDSPIGRTSVPSGIERRGAA